jgi:hypothetical protein
MPVEQAVSEAAGGVQEDGPSRAAGANWEKLHDPAITAQQDLLVGTA